jgi:hypothetical protein
MIFRGREPSAALSGGAVRGKAKWPGNSRVKIQSLIGRPARMARLRMGWTDRHTATDELGAKVSGTSARRVGKRLSRCLRATREPLNNPTGNAKPSTLFEARVSGAAEPSGCAAAIQGHTSLRGCWLPGSAGSRIGLRALFESPATGTGFDFADSLENAKTGGGPGIGRPSGKPVQRVGTVDRFAFRGVSRNKSGRHIDQGAKRVRPWLCQGRLG